MSQLRMGGLVPGAEITILVDADPAKKVVQTKSTRTDDVFGVDASVALPLGSKLTAFQRASGVAQSPTVPSLKLEAVDAAALRCIGTTFAFATGLMLQYRSASFCFTSAR